MLHCLRLGLSFAFLCCLCLHGTTQAEEISIEDALKLLKSQQKVGDTSVVTNYVVRHTEPSGTLAEEEEKAVALVKESLDQAREMRIKNDRSFGVEPDIKALEANDAATLKEYRQKFRKNFTGGVRTYASRVTVAGANWREERMTLPNDRPIEDVVELVQEQGFRPDFVETWNGERCAYLKRPAAAKQQSYEVNPTKSGYAGVRSQQPSSPSILNSVATGPLAADSVEAMKKANVDFQATRSDTTLTINVTGPVTFPQEMTASFAVNYGYAMTKLTVKIRGQVIRSDEYSDFYKTKSGLWIPQRVVVETRDAKTGKLKHSTEQIAFDKPVTDVQLPSDSFDLAETEEFKSLPQEAAHVHEVQTPAENK